jgi:signal transduction histidine kinase
MTTASLSRPVIFWESNAHVGIGLTGMRERVRELGGCLGLISDGRGTVSVVMPILLPTSDLAVKSL